MAEKETFTPKQKRAIETRKKIVESGFLIFAKKGYYHTTVDEIANSAGCSTGIAYRYFKNKKDLLLAVLEYSYGHIQQFTRTDLSVILSQEDEKKVVEDLLDALLAVHQKYYALHEELEGLRHSNDEIRVCYDQLERRFLTRIRGKLPKQYQQMEHSEEKITFAYLMMENYCHMAVGTKYLLLDQDYLKQQTIDTIIEFLK